MYAAVANVTRSAEAASLVLRGSIEFAFDFPAGVRPFVKSVAVRPQRAYLHSVPSRMNPVLITEGLAAGVALAIGIAMARWFWRLYTNRSEGLGRVSQRWLAVHRTENL